ncbi:hypothetical protein [Halomarina rubra]|uniref:DUF998 domain-containing protein n=1 Tax=Halomarina rubra TaxID=2071873 RepID=A0ABD6AYY1_9EURY|nr:hypothetical protein [Halomarina rubra]
MSLETTDAQSNRLAPGPLGLGGRRLDYVSLALSFVAMTGLILDIRKHSDGFSFAEEGFFTPEHTVFYGGFLAVLGLMLVVVYGRRTSGGLSWVDAVPPGYGVGIFGLLLFALGGPGDFVWHTLYGVENGDEALVSPTHLLLVCGGALFVSSPIRAAWRRETPATWAATLPVLAATGLFATVPLAFTMYANPAFLGAGLQPAIGQGLGGFVVHATILAALVVPLARRFTFPLGGYTVTFALVGVAIGYLAQPSVLAPYLAAGVVADVLTARLDAGRDSRGLRLVAVAVPTVWALTYFLVVEALGTIVWTVHVWTGAIALSALAGLCLSFVVVPSPHAPPSTRSGDEV